MSEWVNFVKSYAKKHNLAYGCALNHADCSKEYHISKERKKQTTKTARLKQRENEKVKAVKYANKISSQVRREAKQLLNSQSVSSGLPIDLSKDKIITTTPNIYKKKSGLLF